MRYRQIGFESTLTRKDYRSAVYFNKLFRRKLLCGLLIAWVALGLGVPVVCWLLELPAYLYYVSAALLAMLAFYIIKLQMDVRQVIANDKLSVGSIREITVFDDSIVVSGGKGRYRAEYRWKMFSQAYELKNFFLLYTTPQHALIIPKRDVPAYELEPMRNIFKAGLGKKLRILIDLKEAAPPPKKETDVNA